MVGGTSRDIKFQQKQVVVNQGVPLVGCAVFYRANFFLPGVGQITQDMQLDTNTLLYPKNGYGGYFVLKNSSNAAQYFYMFGPLDLQKMPKITIIYGLDHYTWTQGQSGSPVDQILHSSNIVTRGYCGITIGVYSSLSNPTTDCALTTLEEYTEVYMGRPYNKVNTNYIFPNNVGSSSYLVMYTSFFLSGDGPWPTISQIEISSI